MVMSTFKKAKKGGNIYWNELQKAIIIIKKINLDLNYTKEAQFEDRISGALQPTFENFIDQRNIQQKMTRVTIFGHDHRPDMSIGVDGTAIEVKIGKNGQSYREALGQSLIYRMTYRFVIVVVIDNSKNKAYREQFKDESSAEFKLIKELEKNNIYMIIK